MIWFTADTHFDDEKTLLYRYRPFQNVKKMNQAIVKNWNSCISPKDTVFHLGDFAVSDDAVEEYAPMLNGKIKLIMGNHDDVRDRKILEKYFELKDKPYILKFNHNGKGDQIFICHYPKQRPDVEKNNIYTACGHIHDLWKITRKMVNVGVDAWHFKPVSLQQILDSRQAELDGHWDANVYPDASFEWQWTVSLKRGEKAQGKEPTMDILRKEIERNFPPPR